jgi:hypothetical protein
MIHGGNMTTLIKEVEVEFNMCDFTDQELLDELAERDLISGSHGDGNDMIDKIYHLRRQGLPYERELDEYLYHMTGRAV